MTDPRQSENDEQIKPEEETEPEVEVELIKDLDVPSADQEDLRGARACSATYPS